MNLTFYESALKSDLKIDVYYIFILGFRVTDLENHLRSLTALTLGDCILRMK